MLLTFSIYFFGRRSIGDKKLCGDYKCIGGTCPRTERDLVHVYIRVCTRTYACVCVLGLLGLLESSHSVTIGYFP